ncbi:MAG: hypothetical protein U0802_18725 [Candidatus Binatia bacterium]
MGVRSTALLAAVWLALAPSARAATCPGDCSGDGAISVDELVRGVERALGIAAAMPCPAWDDRAPVTVVDLVASVAAALAGCPPQATPTGTPTTTPAPPLPTDTASASPTTDATPDPIARAVDVICPPLGHSRWITADDGNRYLRCDLAGHWTEVGLRAYDSVTLASEAFRAGFDPAAAFDFHGLPAMYREVPFYIPSLGGADRFLTWRFHCWVVSVHSFDDTIYRLAPQVIPVSETLLAEAGAFLRAACAPPPVARPDLVPSRISASYGGNGGCRGPFGSLHVCVANRGTAPAPDFAVAVEPGVKLEFPPLAAGEEKCLSEPLPLAVSFFTVRVDPDEARRRAGGDQQRPRHGSRPADDSRHLFADANRHRVADGERDGETADPHPFPSRSPTVTRTRRATRTATRTRRPTGIPTGTPTPTATPSCAPTGTPYCADVCVPCPTVRPGCYRHACGRCSRTRAAAPAK